MPSCAARIYPLQRPENHQPPVPRWQLVFGPGITHVYAVYVGVQRHDGTREAGLAGDLACKAVRSWLDGCAGAGMPVTEEFDVIDGDGAAGTHVWVCYWTDEASYQDAMDRLSPADIQANPPPAERRSIGVWREAFGIPVSRVETNYSGLDYLPGLARLPGTSTEEHTLTAYWGAARDRIPDAGRDLFEADETVDFPGSRRPLSGVGRHLVGGNSDNVVHIRSGQFWERCDGEEREGYERRLRPALEAGLRYLWDNPSESGARGLRYLRNSDGGGGDDAAGRKESCVAGFFTSLDRLEGWAKSHKSHLAIYNGAMRHAKVFGPGRKFRTWHEVVVLKKGVARVEYVNCVEGTGLMGYTVMDDIS